MPPAEVRTGETLGGWEHSLCFLHMPVYPSDSWNPTMPVIGGYSLGATLLFLSTTEMRMN